MSLKNPHKANSVFMRERPATEMPGIGIISKEGYEIIGIDYENNEYLLGSLNTKEFADELLCLCRKFLANGLTIQDMAEIHKIYISGDKKALDNLIQKQESRKDEERR